MKNMTEMLEACAENGWPVVGWAQWPPTAEEYYFGADWPKIIHPSAGYWRFKRWGYVNGGWFIYEYATVWGGVGFEPAMKTQLKANIRFWKAMDRMSIPPMVQKHMRIFMRPENECVVWPVEVIRYCAGTPFKPSRRRGWRTVYGLGSGNLGGKW